MHSRTFKDSGNFNLINDAIITAGSIYAFDVDKRFSPYEQILISNSGASDLIVITNYKTTSNFVVRAGETRNLHSSCEDIRIKNIGTTQFEVNEIQITLRHTGDVEKTKMLNKLQIVSQVAMLKNLL